MEEQKIFTKIVQVAIVVRDIESSVKKFYDTFQIGPWEIHTYTPKNTDDMQIRGKPCGYSMKLAFTRLGDIQIELIQPLDDKSIYAEFLHDKGEGLHHLGFDTPDYENAIKFAQDKGIGILQQGSHKGYGYTYLDTTPFLSFISEIFKPPKNIIKESPESTYP